MGRKTFSISLVTLLLAGFVHSAAAAPTSEVPYEDEVAYTHMDRMAEQYSIYRVDPEVGVPMLVVPGSYKAHAPIWSPDKTHVAFASFVDGELYVAKADGSEIVRLTSDKTDPEGIYLWGEGAHWSPDGTTLVYAHGESLDCVECVTNTQIRTVSIDGTRRKSLTDRQGHVLLPSWSPNGRRIAYIDNWQVVVMKADGSRKRQLTTGAPRGTSALTWAPGSRRIAFARWRYKPSANYEIFVIKTDGTNRTRISRNPADDMRPSWSPDGTKIAFVRPVAGRYEVFLMNPDGSQQQQLTSVRTQTEGDFAWSPDGERIAYLWAQWSTLTEQWQSKIFIYDRQGIAAELPTGEHQPMHPDW